jgi:alanyl-tRNA synthetase
MVSSDLRKKFLGFFIKKGHKDVASSTVVPLDDPTLLFTNAGMNQFKNLFLGIETPEFRRTCSIQKCIRASGKHNDLEDVGMDGSHHTFFEMMGNWSFGDYYKREAAEWAWEFATEILSLPQESLWVSIYKDDDEAYDIWLNGIGVDKKRLVRLGDLENGDEENFWSMGETGPCGPCSEILYDYAPGKKKSFEEGSITGDICELWNLVFMEFNRELDGKLVPLPEKHIDTGMGLERTLAVLQGKRSNYETDLFVPLIEKIEELSGRSRDSYLMSFQVISDHIRSLAFAIADGAVPSNEGRGYVLRRILRRAARHGKILGLDRPFLHDLINPLVDMMKDPYIELSDRQQHIKKLIFNEEELFLRTLDRGLAEFERTAVKLTKKRVTIFPGKDAFLLHDTYGFPFDLTELMAREKGLSVDRVTFDREMEGQKRRARRGSKFKVGVEQGEWIKIGEDAGTRFFGYDMTDLEDMRILKYKREENKVLLVFDKTPFYAESGGQVGDRGYVEAEGVRISVEDVKPMGELFVHIGTLDEGSLDEGALRLAFSGHVDVERRKHIMANHTATHLLHSALKQVVGTHATQAGSLVAPDRLRFDFNHYNQLDREQLDRIEEIVNSAIMANIPVSVKSDVPMQEAREMGAVALFGEKYGEKVRVVTVDDHSTELCGGTHAERTGDIGLFKIVKEGSISSGVRRIEAVTGTQSLRLVRQDEKILREAAMILRTNPEGIVDSLNKLVERSGDLELRLKKEKKKGMQDMFDIEKDKVVAGKYSLLHIEISDLSGNELREVSDSVKGRIKMGVIFITSRKKDRVGCVISVTDDAVKEGLHAGTLLEEIAPLFGGRGGGRPQLAQGGGTNPQGTEKSFERLVEIVKKL